MKNAVEMNENQVAEEVKEAEAPVETEVKKEKVWKVLGFEVKKAQKEPKKETKNEEAETVAPKPESKLKKFGKKLGIAGLVVAGIAGGTMLGSILNDLKTNDEDDQTMALPPQEAEWKPVEESKPVSEDPATMESPKED